jgi:O-antigen/teichoic acid export membrane protein
VFTNVVNFLLVPLYTTFLNAADYGVLALLLLFSTVAKILFRMGLDGGFFRVHYDLEDPAARSRLAGTVASFAALSATVLFLLVVLLRGPLTRLLFHAEAPPSRFVALAAADVWLSAFAFVPLNLLRIQDRPGAFSAFSACRHALNTVLKVVLVMRGHGVEGILWSDALSTGAFSLALLPVLLRGASWSWDTGLLREVLGFGLPKVPHGVLVQVLNLADRKVLDLFVTRAEVGIYQMGYTFGTGVKFALSAFEPAWQPFVYSRIREADGARTLARVASWAFAAFAGVGLAFAVLAPELLRIMTRNPAFWSAAPVVPVVTLAYVLHGAFLLGSVGIAIQKRARYYPIITAAAAATNVAANFALIPRFGILGAAWATVLSYAVMATLGIRISQRLYPLPLEWPRLLGVALAAGVTYGLSLLAGGPLWTALGVKLACLGSYPAQLFLLGFRKPPPSALNAL